MTSINHTKNSEVSLSSWLKKLHVIYIYMCIFVFAIYITHTYFKKTKTGKHDQIPDFLVPGIFSSTKKTPRDPQKAR